MFSRLICFILVGISLIQIGCANKTNWVEALNDPGLSLPQKVDVTLKSKRTFEIADHVRTEPTDRISGELVEWNDHSEVVFIKVSDHSGQSGELRIPIRDIEKIYIRGSNISVKGIEDAVVILFLGCLAILAIPALILHYSAKYGVD